ncbi:hypothetical protein TWF481_009226 [Arthrobotrys musiformis]|uniref:Uncharacterized protein n=1 Tax=Arthrobotrys musiformis TaxID=47236 RepID=A0AAV9W370_9PEZI
MAIKTKSLLVFARLLHIPQSWRPTPKTKKAPKKGPIQRFIGKAQKGKEERHPISSGPSRGQGWVLVETPRRKVEEDDDNEFLYVGSGLTLYPVRA